MTSKHVACLAALLLSVVSTSAETVPPVSWTKTVKPFVWDYGAIDLENDGVSEVYYSDSNGFSILNGKDGTAKWNLRVPLVIDRWVLNGWSGSQIADLNLRNTLVSLDGGEERDLLAAYLCPSPNSVIIRDYSISIEARRRSMPPDYKWQTLPIQLGGGGTNVALFDVTPVRRGPRQRYDVAILSKNRTFQRAAPYTSAHMVDGHNGRLIWSQTFPYSEGASDPILVDLENDGVTDVLFYFPDRVKVFDSFSGKLKWEISPQKPFADAKIIGIAGFRRADLNRWSFADFNQRAGTDMIVQWRGAVDHNQFSIQAIQISGKGLIWQKTYEAGYVLISPEAWNLDRDGNREIALTLFRYVQPARPESDLRRDQAALDDPPSWVPRTDHVVLDGSTGAVKWTQSFEGWGTSPHFADVNEDGTTDLVVVRPGTGAQLPTLSGLDGATGQQIWSFSSSDFYTATALSLSTIFRDLDHPVFRDFDDDGSPYFLITDKPESPQRFRYRLFDSRTKILKWSFAPGDFANGFVSFGAVGDFDGDRGAEILYEGVLYSDWNRTMVILNPR